MKNVQDIRFHIGSNEELLPGFASDFPYIASCAKLDRYPECFVPWHWHRTIELFYMESGTLEYSTPGNCLIFPEGSGGFVNSNVLHMTRPQPGNVRTIQFLHLFEPSFLAGERGSRIEQKYIQPVITASQLDILAFYPSDPKQKEILKLIHEAFFISEREYGYEIRLREALSNIWLALFRMAEPMMDDKENCDVSNGKIKLIMTYIYEHYSEKISISQLASAAFISERECFRIFHECLNVTPAEYLKNYRLQMACRMLEKGRKSISEIAYACGLGSSSYFGKIFRKYIGCSPMEYRLKMQDNTMNRQ